MSEQEFERKIAQIMKADLSVGAEGFREELLTRCLDVLDEDGEIAIIADDDLELIAAAGDVGVSLANTRRLDGFSSEDGHNNHLV